MVFVLALGYLNISFLRLSFPVDVVEIGERRANIGDVLKVKPLAALAMIDEGELDWKIVAISLDDPKASLVNDVDDVEKHFPV
jgi:inorganic pyrophosphatase